MLEPKNDEDIDLEEDSAPNESTDLNANNITTGILLKKIH